ncbi:MAG: hypothetical protein IPJ45_10250 [Ignavibacteria bacterium]|nr:hypothetical protein [Ignavibacteria bacterium]
MIKKYLGTYPDKAGNRYVAEAVDALINGTGVKIEETKSIGGQIKFIQ